MRNMKLTLGEATLETYFPEPISGVAATSLRPCLLDGMGQLGSGPTPPARVKQVRARGLMAHLR